MYTNQIFQTITACIWIKLQMEAIIRGKQLHLRKYFMVGRFVLG